MKLVSICAVAGMLLAAPAANATTIVFSGLTTNGASVGTYSENGFTLTALTGTSPDAQTYGGLSSTGAPSNPMLLLPYAESGFDLTAGGSLFSLASYQSARNGGGNYASSFAITGYVGNVQTFSSFSGPNSTTLTTINPGSGALLFDRVRFSLATFNPTGVVLDNIEVSAVPEPASWMLTIAGFGLIGAAARGQRRRIGISFG